ncbi:hypothetical protein [Caballeronia sp. 15711]|uniref:hypothetical protein n=1 Tax=Caballeronia sp. 15711 TaxID=3391029 RepID=UPI0039E6FE0A
MKARLVAHEHARKSLNTTVLTAQAEAMSAVLNGTLWTDPKSPDGHSSREFMMQNAFAGRGKIAVSITRLRSIVVAEVL